MPTYQYECQSCQYEFEIVQSMRDEELIECPSCKELKLMRVVTGGLGFFLDEPKTIGRLAEINTKKMGHYERDEKLRRDDEAKASDPANKMKQKIKLANKTDTPEKATKYIMEGE